ncbi:MAG: hemerythrin family protein [Chloroflexi bacterium]|jgi:hemerythrin|nr:hemerythrin family protein [Chloroflexota bacterium]
MSFFNWKPEYSVNIEQFDAQHKQLVSLIDRLFNAMQSGRGREVAGDIISELITYTQTHFADEERVMQTYGYPGYLAHCREHQELVQAVSDMQKQYQSGNHSIAVSLSNFLKSWLTNHILGTDRQYSSFLNAKGVK